MLRFLAFVAVITTAVPAWPLSIAELDASAVTVAETLGPRSVLIAELSEHVQDGDVEYFVFRTKHLIRGKKTPDTIVCRVPYVVVPGLGPRDDVKSLVPCGLFLIRAGDRDKQSLLAWRPVASHTDTPVIAFEKKCQELEALLEQDVWQAVESGSIETRGCMLFHYQSRATAAARIDLLKRLIELPTVTAGKYPLQSKFCKWSWI